MNISAVIVIKNNPPHLLEMLASIEDFVSEVIIGEIDVDAKLHTALAANPKYIFKTLPSDIPYADLIKEDLKKMASGEYILYMDPDELLPKRLSELLNQKMSEYDFFYLPRKNMIFGKWIEHSRWWPDYQLRFFKKDAVIWPKTIHPIPETKGKGYHVEAHEELALLHFNYENIDEFMEKMSRYAKHDAFERLEQKQDYTLHEAVKMGLSEFISRFFAAEGYKDGMHGLVLAFLQLFYYLLVYFYTWEYKKYPESSMEEMINSVDVFFQNGLFESSYWEDKKQMKNSFRDKLKLKLLKKL